MTIFALAPYLFMFLTHHYGSFQTPGKCVTNSGIHAHIHACRYTWIYRGVLQMPVSL